jgi:hypothetical protein
MKSLLDYGCGVVFAFASQLAGMLLALACKGLRLIGCSLAPALRQHITSKKPATCYKHLLPDALLKTQTETLHPVQGPLKYYVDDLLATFTPCPTLPAELWGRICSYTDDFTLWMVYRYVSHTLRSEAEREFAHTRLPTTFVS